MGRGANLEEEVELFMAAREKVDAECQNRTSSRQACWILYGTYAKWQSKVSKVGFRQSGEKASIWSSYHPPGQVPDKLGGFSVWNLCNWQSKGAKLKHGDKWGGGAKLEQEVELFMAARENVDVECQNSCIEAISDFRDYQLRISNVSANDKKAKIVCGVAVLISVVAENLKNSAWIDDFYRCLPASDAFNEGYMQIKFDRVKKPVSGVRILQDKFPPSLLDSVWNLCNWQSKVQGKAILEQIIYRDFLCIFKLSSVTASRCVLGNLLVYYCEGPVS
ncbi:hypothetical protein D5086_033077 [Populus alba]|uniref:Uncharacterized protein n=1 Tax=Populus alba TaxID=43335 RepID=A0ACC4AFW0_POPAL